MQLVQHVACHQFHTQGCKSIRSAECISEKEFKSNEAPRPVVFETSKGKVGGYNCASRPALCRLPRCNVLIEKIYYSQRGMRCRCRRGCRCRRDLPRLPWHPLITNQVPHLLDVHLPLPLHPSYFLPYRSHRGSLSLHLLYTITGSLVQPNLTTGNPHVSPTPGVDEVGQPGAAGLGKF